MSNAKTSKFIPIIRKRLISVNGCQNESSVPCFLDGYLYVDFTEENKFQSSLKELVRLIHGIELKPKPPVSGNPFLMSYVDIANDKIDTTAVVKGIITGTKVNMRKAPTVAAKIVTQLNIGDEVVILKKIRTENRWEVQLCDDFQFINDLGECYTLRAGVGLRITGHRGDLYRIEFTRSKRNDVGYIHMNLVRRLNPGVWFQIRMGCNEGWVYHRYVVQYDFCETTIRG